MLTSSRIRLSMTIDFLQRVGIGCVLVFAASSKLVEPAPTLLALAWAVATEMCY